MLHIKLLLEQYNMNAESIPPAVLVSVFESRITGDVKVTVTVIFGSLAEETIIAASSIHLLTSYFSIGSTA